MILSNLEIREFEEELHSLYPFLSEKETSKIIEEMIEYWSFTLEKICK